MYLLGFSTKVTAAGSVLVADILGSSTKVAAGSVFVAGAANNGEDLQVQRINLSARRSHRFAIVSSARHSAHVVM